MPSTYGDGNGNGDSRIMDFVPLSRSVFKTKIRDISPDDMTSSVSSLQLSPGSDKDASESQSAADRREINSVDSAVLKVMCALLYF